MQNQCVIQHEKGYFLLTIFDTFWYAKQYMPSLITSFKIPFFFTVQTDLILEELMDMRKNFKKKLSGKILAINILLTNDYRKCHCLTHIFHESHNLHVVMRFWKIRILNIFFQSMSVLGPCKSTHLKTKNKHKGLFLIPLNLIILNIILRISDWVQLTHYYMYY